MQRRPAGLRLRRVLLALALPAVSPLAAAEQPPPFAHAEPHDVTLFGMTFHDPYHWMESGGERLTQWMLAQSAYTRRLLDRVPGRAGILEELRRLDAAETQVSGAVLAGGTWIYSKTRPEDSFPKIFARPAAGGTERIVVDPARFDANGLTARIDYWTAAPDGRHVAYGTSIGGGETGMLRIADVATGTDLPERWDRTRYARPAWLDGESFLYPRLPPPGTGGKQPITGASLYLHRLGSDPASDPRVFGPGPGPGVVGGHAQPTEYFFRAVASAASPYVIAEYDAGLGNSPQAVFVTTKERLRAGDPAWRQVAAFADDVRGVVPQGEWLYVRTAHRAPRLAVLRVPGARPDLARAETVLRQGDASIAGMTAAADALYVTRTQGGIGQLVRIPWNGTPERIAPPFEGSFIGVSAVPSEPGATLRTESWTRSQTVFHYDAAIGAFADTGIAPPSVVSFADIDWIDVHAPARDGSRIPVSIVAPRGAKRDGSHPLLLYAYGAYGATLEPSFDATRRVWFDHGGIYAVAHVRGSGGFGEAWHRAGRLDKKRNSVTDFIDAAHYLEQEGWTSRDRIAAMGGSAGGIVIGGAVVTQPSLFSAAIIEVGLLNMLRLEQIPIGAVNTNEFGSTETEEGVRLLASIDAYLQLKKGVAYPGVLVATKLNDARVSPWMPAKFAARLQASDAGPRPDLLRVEAGGGHGLGTRAEVQAELADYFAFLLWQAGLPEFQPPR
ncbi:MAG: prolyl oligopeptidase family serine peptidase [Proteobacteria bacterium]|nr:prolyl oligopeptidase family serine peptidase [Pseudomonadota bacterium]